jgi:hypothetical protein
MSETEIKADATQALADTKTKIASLETDAQTGLETVVVNVEAAAKTFYEKHVTAFAAVAGAAVGALAMLVKIKLL